MQAASRMSHTIDTQRPRKLTEVQRAQVNYHLEVKLLWRRKNKLKAFIRDRYGSIDRMKGTPIYDQYRSAYHDHRNTRRQHQEAVLKEVKAKDLRK